MLEMVVDSDVWQHNLETLPVQTSRSDMFWKKAYFGLKL